MDSLSSYSRLAKKLVGKTEHEIALMLHSHSEAIRHVDCELEHEPDFNVRAVEECIDEQTPWLN